MSDHTCVSHASSTTLFRFGRMDKHDVPLPRSIRFPFQITRFFLFIPRGSTRNSVELPVGLCTAVAATVTVVVGV